MKYGNKLYSKWYSIWSNRRQFIFIGFADDKNEPKEYVIVERALEFDEQDIKLGMDSYYFEYSDQSNSGYGLCSKVVIRQNEIVFSVKHKYEDDITQ